VVNAGLAGLSTREAGGHDAQEEPAAVLGALAHEGTSGVALARVLAAPLVARADHVLEYLQLRDKILRK
jgi:hypothetical protein